MGNSERLQVDGQPLTDQEQFILNQAAQGKRADLREQFGNKEKDRQVRAMFLEELISGSLDKVNIKRQGVLIGNAIISEPFNLELATVMYAVSFKACEFRNAVDFGHAYFMSHLAISESTFYGSAKFRQIKVDRNFLCRKTTFRGIVDFGRAKVAEDFDVKGARFENQEHEVNFNGIRVGQSASFNGAIFRGPVDFTLAKIEGNLSLEVLIEDGIEKETKFESSVNFAGSIINGQFQAELTRFEGTELIRGYEGNAVFLGMNVKDSAYFDGALFEGDVDFSLIKVGLNFSIIPVMKNSLEIKTILKGNVRFGGAKIGGQFQANGAYFGDSIKMINFNGIQVEESAFFVNAVFRGQVNFVAANIMGLLDVSGAQFLNETPAAFEGIKVGSSAIFRDTIFLGNILLNHSTLTDLYIEGNYLCSLISLLHMDSTIVQRELRIANTKVNTFYANHLQVMGPARLINIFITDLADFQNASYQSLDLSNVTWPRSRNKVLLEGLTYETISAEGNPNDCDGLLNWLKSCRFSRQAYTQLESYFLKRGHKESADKVFIRMRQKEVALLSWWKKWPTKILWGGLTGYGRKPYLSIPWIMLIVALGALAFPLTFDGKTLESHLWLTQMAKSYPSTMKIILSLDRFLPGVDLGVAKYWAPPVNFCFLAWIYWYIQKLLGWVLVPIALAAIYTRIK